MGKNRMEILQSFIDILKRELYEAIELNDGNMLHPTVIRLSQRLDKLILLSYQ